LAKLLVKDYLEQDEEARTARMLNGLTPREREVLTHLAEGKTNTEMGEDLGISPKTVARHRENIMQKLNLHSRAELVRYAIRKGIIKP
jgi:two-component system response regulator NreC